MKKIGQVRFFSFNFFFSFEIKSARLLQTNQE